MQISSTRFLYLSQQAQDRSPVAKQLFLPDIYKFVIGQSYKKCNEISHYPYKRKAYIERDKGIEHIQILPAAMFLSDKDDHDQVQQGVKKKGDKADKGIFARQFPAGSYKLEWFEDGNRANENSLLLPIYIPKIISMEW